MMSNEERCKIVEMAVQMFNTYGCKGVTMDQIAKAMHISKRTLYETFDSKEALLMECLTAVHKTLGREWLEQFKETDEPFLMAIFIVHNATKKGARYSRLLKDADLYHPELSQQLLKKYNEEFKSALTKLFEDAQKKGDLREGVDITSVVDLISRYGTKGCYTVGFDNKNYPKELLETCFTYLRGLLSIQAIERYDRNEEKFKKMLNE